MPSVTVAQKVHVSDISRASRILSLPPTLNHLSACVRLGFETIQREAMSGQSGMPKVGRVAQGRARDLASCTASKCARHSAYRSAMRRIIPTLPARLDSCPERELSTSPRRLAQVPPAPVLGANSLDKSMSDRGICPALSLPSFPDPVDAHAPSFLYSYPRALRRPACRPFHASIRGPVRRTGLRIRIAKRIVKMHGSQ